MGKQTGSRRRPAEAAFTLIELLLTVTLLLLMAAAAVVNFDSFQRGSQLDEGATLVESLLRYSRAQSASTGRTLRWVFDGINTSPATGAGIAVARVDGMQVLWEPDPLNAPGRFELMRNAAPFTERLNELIEVRRVRSPQAPNEPANAGTHRVASMLSSGLSSGLSDTNSSAGTDEGPGGNGRPPIVFYPDGSSDSVELLLVSRAADDRRQMVLTLSGVVGTTRRRWLSVDASGQVETEAEPDANKAAEAKP